MYQPHLLQYSSARGKILEHHLKPHQSICMSLDKHKHCMKRRPKSRPRSCAIIRLPFRRTRHHRPMPSIGKKSCILTPTFSPLNLPLFLFKLCKVTPLQQKHPDPEFRATVEKAHLRYNTAAQSMMEPHSVENLMKVSDLGRSE